MRGRSARDGYRDLALPSRDMSRRTGRPGSASAGLVVLAAVLLGGCSGGDQTPEEVVQEVIDARTAGECDGFEEHFVDEDDPFPRCEEGDPVDGDGSQLRDAEIAGEKATVEVVDHYDCSSWDEPDVEYVDVYHLVMQDGAWKVEDWSPSETTSDDCFS